MLRRIFTTLLFFFFDGLDENTGDVPDAANGEESREAEDSVAAVTKNGTATEEAEHHVNGNGTADKNGEAAADCKFNNFPS